MDESSLLNEFVRTRSEEAFRRIVMRHLSLVHAAARRQVRDPGLADDVTQGVFIVLARKAGTIRNPAALCGWLLSTTHHMANSAKRARARRAEHETEAGMQSQQARSEQAQSSQAMQAWREMEPAIDAAMASLPAIDRDVLALRFFESKSLSAVGEAIGASEEAARKRVDRALTKLRSFLRRRQLDMSLGTIAGGMASAAHNSAAPGALASTITASVLAPTGAAAGAGFSLASAVMKGMFWMKVKLAALLLIACAVPLTVAAIAVPHAATRRSVTVAPTYFIHGRLVDGQGAPVAGAQVVMDADRDAVTQQWQAVSDANGRFTLSNSLNAKFLISVEKPGYRMIQAREMQSSDALQAIAFFRNLTVSGIVTDARTHQPIRNYKMMSGQGWDDQRFLDRDRDVTVPGPRYSILLGSSNQKIWVHFEAPGYLPADSPIYRTEEGAVTANIELTPAPNTIVHVLLPNGKPAVGATIYLGGGGNGIGIYLNDALPKQIKGPTSQRSTPRFQSSADGSFTLTPQTGRYQLVAVHESGIGYAFGDPAHPPKTIRLAPWSQLSGHVAASLRTGNTQQVTASMQLLGGGFYRQEYKLGPDGAFKFEHVPAGNLIVGIDIEFSRARTGITVMDHAHILKIAPGQTINIQIGGSGATVTGSVALGPSIKGTLASYFAYGQLISPWTSLSSRPTTAEVRQLEANQTKSTSFAIRISDRGTFTIKDVPPGRYVLHVEVQEVNQGPSWGMGRVVAQVRKNVDVPATARSDLGTLTLQPAPPSSSRP